MRKHAEGEGVDVGEDKEAMEKDEMQVEGRQEKKKRIMKKVYPFIRWKVMRKKKIQAGNPTLKWDVRSRKLTNAKQCIKIHNNLYVWCLFIVVKATMDCKGAVITRQKWKGKRVTSSHIIVKYILAQCRRQPYERLQYCALI